MHEYSLKIEAKHVALWRKAGAWTVKGYVAGERDVRGRAKTNEDAKLTAAGFQHLRGPGKAEQAG